MEDRGAATDASPALAEHRTQQVVNDDSAAAAASEILLWKVAVETTETAWRALPAEMQTNPALARRIAYFPNVGVARDILGRFSALRRDRAYWGRILETLPENAAVNEELEGLFAATGDDGSLAAPNIRSDPQLMLQACRRNHRILQSVHGTLGTDRTFLEALLKETPAALQVLNPHAQRLYPELVVQAFAPLGRQYVHLSERDPGFAIVVAVARGIVPEIWESSRSHVLEWFRCGLPFARSVFPASWLDDPEIFLLVARHCPHPFQRDSFLNASPSALRGDKDFMRQVLEVAPSLFPCASEILQRDFDLALLCFADSYSAVLSFLHQNGTFHNRAFYERLDFLREFCHRALELDRLHETFVSTILAAMSPSLLLLESSSSSGSSSALVMLDQGAETALSHKRLIAAYLGVPTGKTLRRLRRARANVTELLENFDPASH